jgi:hypothetical protein
MGDTRRLARGGTALLVDLAVVFVVVPALFAVPIIAGFTWLFDAGSGDCRSPCDGSPMAASGVWILFVLLFAALYWPVLRWRKRRTVGQWLLTRRRASTAA